MYKHEKEIIQAQLDKEEAVLKELEKEYQAALSQINEKIMMLQSDELTQSRIYQIQYQKALKGQVEAILEKLHADEYSTIQQYVSDSYTDAFVGTMYSFHKQKVPIILPIDKKAAVKAILTDSKISESLYEHLGINVKFMKKRIPQEITRGISAGLSYTEIIRNLKEATNAPLANAKTIVRTEGHRIQQASAEDARQGAKAKGADVVKQWDATLDGDTRPVHKALDGQIREPHEPFEYGNKKPMYPGDFGNPADDCNCRCVALTRARWALDEDELKTMQERAAFFGLDKSDSFEEFKEKYLKAAEDASNEVDFAPAKNIAEAEEFAKKNGVKYADYSKLPLATANELNYALATLPDDAKPVFVGASTSLEQYWGGKLPRSSKQYYGVTISTFNGIHLGPGKGYDFDAEGYMVGISSSYKTSEKITLAKQEAQKRYQQKYGRKWFFNETGETTAAHEMGHVYANIKGLPKGFENDAARWAKEAGCDMLQKPSEAWAEAWAAYHTKANPLPDYIAKYIQAASGRNKAAKPGKGLIFFDDDGIIRKKIDDFKHMFETGKIRTIISKQKQARHVKGTQQFEEYCKKMALRGDYPSYIREDLSAEDLNRIVVSKLRGKVQYTNGKSFREFVLCDEIVGYYFSKLQGKYVATRCAQINYAIGDGNIHIIPVKELQGGGLFENND